MKTLLNKNVIILGAGGHAKSIAEIIVKNEDNLIGFLDDNILENTVITRDPQIKVIGKISDSLKYDSNKYCFVIGIGDNMKRKEIFEKYSLNYYTAIHPSANISLDVEIGTGTVVMANASINTSAKIGKQVIINTGAIIEHDNEIADFVHISPGAMLAGNVKIAENTHIGIGVTIKNNISICANAIVGAGATVVKNIDDAGTYIGIPAVRMTK